MRTWVYRVAHNTATSKVLRPRANAPSIVRLEDSLESVVYVAYRYRKWRLAAPPVALGRTNCVEFYRAELLRQRDLSKDSWDYLLPFVPGMTLAILDGVLEARRATDRIVLVLLGVALFLGLAWWNAHAAHKLQNEIDALDAS
jgi:hypothetical protein